MFRNETKEWYHVRVHGEEIVCTGGHPFCVQGKGFVKAKELTLKDLLTLSDSTQVFIENIEVEKLETPETKYNFEVEDFHTYYVTESNILVHNDCYLDPNEINYTQDSIANEFKRGSHKGESIDDLIDALKTGKVSPDDIPALEVFKHNGKIYSVNNRRLFAYKMAGVKKVPVKWVNMNTMHHPLTGDGVSIIVRGGSKYL